MPSVSEINRPIPIEKKIAVRFRIWLRKHKEATHDEKVAKFNEIADEMTGQ
jgi:hypothetical protein